MTNEEKKSDLQELHKLLEDEVFNIIGDDGKRRLRRFLEYGDAWFLGEGKPLNILSVKILKDFLKKLPMTIGIQPSVFLTLEGCVELVWEDKLERRVEVGLFTDKIEYFFESGNEEATIHLYEMDKLIDKITAVME